LVGGEPIINEPIGFAAAVLGVETFFFEELGRVGLPALDVGRELDDVPGREPDEAFMLSVYGEL
jgi:hypothetical protein